MIPIDDDEDIAFEDDEPEAGDDLDVEGTILSRNSDLGDDVEYQEDDYPDTPPPETEPGGEFPYPEEATDEGAPGITKIVTSTAPEGEQVSEADVPANSGKSGAYIAMPGGKRVRET